MIAAGSITASSAHAGVNTRFVTHDIDLRGPDVAANTLRWLATVEPIDETPPELASLNSGMSEGMGLLVVVTGSATSAAAAQVRGRSQPGRDARRRVRDGVQRQQPLHRRCHLDRVDDRFVDAADRRLEPGGAVVTAATAVTRPRAGRPIGAAADVHVPATVALTLLTVVTAISLCRVFPDWAYLRPMLVVCFGVHAVMCLLRVLKVPRLAGPAGRPGRASPC